MVIIGVIFILRNKIGFFILKYLSCSQKRLASHWCRKKILCCTTVLLE